MLLKIALLLVALMMAPLAHAQTPPPSLPAAPPASAQDGVAGDATLMYFNRPIMTFRSALMGVSAPDRASRAQARIEAQLSAPGPFTVAMKREAAGILVQINGATSFIVTSGDVDPLEQEPLENLAAQGQLMAYEHSGYWQCMDTVRDRDALQAAWDSGRAPWIKQIK